jgi:protein-S-isoprenylcysteine O-methyltransferase
MLAWLTAGGLRRPAEIMLIGWGVMEMALRLRLALRPAAAGDASVRPRAPGRRPREWTFYVVVIALAAAVIAALLTARLSWSATGGGLAVVMIGVLIAVTGITWRIWAILTLDRFFTFVVGIAADHRVVQDGPYRLMRHPGYSGALLTLAGVGVALENWISLLILLVIPAMALGVRIRTEEAVLAGALGAEYLAYAERTPRLVPRF